MLLNKKNSIIKWNGMELKSLLEFRIRQVNAGWIYIAYNK